MKTPFTITQKILYAASTVVLAACVIGDIASVSMEFNGKSDWVFVVNMIFSLISVILFSWLVIKPEKTGIVSKEELAKSGANITSVLSAARTYVCIIYFDVALILFMVLFGSALIPDIELSVIGVAAIIFIIGAVKFISDSRRINLKSHNLSRPTSAPIQKNASEPENKTNDPPVKDENQAKS